MTLKFACTGGPCGGKSTALAYVSEKLSDRGFYPLLVPEAPTLLMLGNIDPRSGQFSEKSFQSKVLRSMQLLEAVFEDSARECNHPKPVIICDRGIPDASAYMPAELYEEILAELNLGTRVEARDRRYNGAFHLVTAALGAEEFYTVANNAARREGLEGARLKDSRTQEAWLGHPHLRIIDNSTDFAGKLHRLDQMLCQALGIPVPLEIECKYRCKPVMDADIPVPFQTIEIEQVYLQTGDSTEMRVRKRGQYGSFVYYRTQKEEVRPGVRAETEDFISAEDYALYSQFRIAGTHPIRKTRRCFVYKSQYFELDKIEQNGKELHLLEIELTQENESVELPPFITVEEDVTNDKRFSNRKLAEAA